MVMLRLQQKQMAATSQMAYRVDKLCEFQNPFAKPCGRRSKYLLVLKAVRGFNFPQMDTYIRTCA